MADDSKVTALKYTGVTFDNIRKAIAYIVYGPVFDEKEAYKYIIPMQSNFLNPIIPEGNDTYIQYFIQRDRKLVQDSFEHSTSICRKVATVSLRFVGAQGENWAKFFHHLTKLHEVYSVFYGTCNAQVLEAIGDILPTPVTFDGVNTVIAFDLDMRLEYIESMDIPWEPLIKVTLAPGEITV